MQWAKYSALEELDQRRGSGCGDRRGNLAEVVAEANPAVTNSLQFVQEHGEHEPGPEPKVNGEQGVIEAPTLQRCTLSIHITFKNEVDDRCDSDHVT